MRKHIPLLCAAAVLAVTLTACGGSRRRELPAAETAAPPAETETTQPRLTIPERAAKAFEADDHIFDEQGVLNEDVREQLSHDLGELSDAKELCMGAVITDDLDGLSPEAFAQTYYTAVWGNQAGLLFLINNETGKDYIFRRRVSELPGEALAIAQASPLLVEKDYAGALDILLPLAEGAAPAE